MCFALIQYSFKLFGQRIVDWACFSGARELLVSNEKPRIQNQMLSDLRLIPFEKGMPTIHLSESQTEVTVELLVPTEIIGTPHELHQKITLLR